MVLSPRINRPSDFFSGSCFSQYIDIEFTDPFWEYLGIDFSSDLLPINIQTSLMQYRIEDDEQYVICDPDMFQISPINTELGDYDVIHENVYENWHMLMQTKNSFYKKLIDVPFNYSGFVPVIIRGNKLKQILSDWVNLHIECIKFKKDTWWAGMYSYNLACAKNELKVREDRLCCIPPLDSEIVDSMFCYHYSVEFFEFDKKDFKNSFKKILNSKSNIQSEQKFIEIVSDWVNNGINPNQVFNV